MGKETVNTKPAVILVNGNLLMEEIDGESQVRWFDNRFEALDWLEENVTTDCENVFDILVKYETLTPYVPKSKFKRV